MYPRRDNFKTPQVRAFGSSCFKVGKIQMWLVWSAVIVLLIFSGKIYRVLASSMVGIAIDLPVPLDTLPHVIGNWTGTELSIPTSARKSVYHRIRS